ncbi:MAG: DUF2254 family protein [Dokdonella sp.]
MKKDHALNPYRILLWLRDRRNRVWTTPAAASVIAIVMAFGAAAGNVGLPPKMLPEIKADTLESLLGVLATSMLSVATFSLAVMVSAFAAASSGTTPRALELVMGDDNTRLAIASFIAAFIYSIIAKTALGLSYYGQNGRFILFLCTLLVLAYLIVTLITWVKTLTRLGRLDNTLEKIEEATQKALDALNTSATMGGISSPDPMPPGYEVRAETVGYLTHIDMASLQELAEDASTKIHVCVRPGNLVSPGICLALSESGEKEMLEKIAEAFVLNSERSYDQDPRFGLIVLSETAQRALSPAVNDPGTAIQVMTIMTRLLIRKPTPSNDDISSLKFDRVSVVELDQASLISDGFDPISRDGAGMLEVCIRMQKLLGIIAKNSNSTIAHAAVAQAKIAVQRAKKRFEIERDVRLLDQIHQTLFGDDDRDGDMAAARDTQ